MTIIPTSDALNQTTCMKQIRKLAECINSRDGGMIANIDFEKENNTYVMVITFADGTSQRFEWDTSPLDISNMTGSFNEGILTVTIYMSNGTSHSFTCPITGMATESYVNTLDSQNVKKTGTSVVTGDIQVPTPAVNTSVVNKMYVDNKRIINDITTTNFLTIFSSMKKGDEIVFNYAHFSDKDSLIQGGHLICVENGSRWIGNVTIGQTGVPSSAPRPIAYNMTLSGNTIGLTYQATYGSYGTQITIDATTLDNINYAIVISNN